MHNASPHESIAANQRIGKQSFWLAVCIATLALLIALLGSTESLWVDELHSSWSISGGPEAIAQRAAAGNQSSVYFWLLWGVDLALGRTLGSEFPLRLPSILAWACAIGLIAHGLMKRESRSAAARSGPATLGLNRGEWSMRLLSVLAVVGWIALDRIQLFYATEARVYACVQLVSLLNWLIVVRLVSSVAHNSPSNSLGPRDARRLQCVWLGLSLLLVYLHLTAALAVAWQWSLVLAVLLVAKRWPGALAVGSWGAIGGLLFLGSLPAVGWSRSVWNRREQWEAFAGDSSLESVLTIFPLSALFIPLLVGLALDRLPRRDPASSQARGRLSDCAPAHWIWLVAALGPLATAWLVTWLDIAPVFHRRFVIVSALPWVLLAASHWQSIRQPAIKLATGVAVVVWLLLSQGTWQGWRHGMLVGWQRAEGWREATEWLDQRVAPEDELWCASGLIEGRDVALPLDAEADRYLSYPLRACYRVVDTLGVSREPRALVNDSSRWPEQWRDSDAGPIRGKIWIVYRGSAAQLDQRLADLKDERLHLAVPPQSFGRVSVAALETSPQE